MKENSAPDSAKTSSLVKRALLYTNVTALKTVNAIPGLYEPVSNYRGKILSFFIVVIIDSRILSFVFHEVAWITDQKLFLAITVYHIVLRTMFNNDIETMSNNYQAWYSKRSRYIFVLYMVLGLSGLLWALLIKNGR